jgi:hypothetical protein
MNYDELHEYEAAYWKRARREVNIVAGIAVGILVIGLLFILGGGLS